MILDQAVGTLRATATTARETVETGSNAIRWTATAVATAAAVTCLWRHFKCHDRVVKAIPWQLAGYWSYSNEHEAFEVNVNPIQLPFGYEIPAP